MFEKNEIAALASEGLKFFFDPENFKQSAAIISDEIKKYYQRADDEPHVRRWVEPGELLAEATAELDGAQAGREVQTKQNQNMSESEILGERVKSLAQKILSNSHNLHSPRYMGHQVPPPLPMAAAFDFLGAAANQAPGLYEMGPFSAVAEKAVIAAMAKFIGWENLSFGAIGTSGGSLANLTAILAARNHRYPEVWSSGLACVKAQKNLIPALAVGADSHYSVDRSAGVLGLGTDQIIKIPLDAQRRMDPAQLEMKLDQAQKEGLDVFCVVATAGSTPIGAFDPLEQIAAVTSKRNIWLHVDGAHGASVLFSKKHAALVKGIEKADSITWDAHKMMYVPALSTFVFYKNKLSKNGAFQQEAPYLNDPTVARAAEFDTFGGTLECTKRPLALGLWAVWSLYGPDVFGRLIDQTFENTRKFYGLLKESPDFEVLHEPQSNILCFRYLPAILKEASLEAQDQLQKSLREQVVKTGEFYITSTKIDGRSSLRVTLINPLTTVDHLKGLLEHIVKKAASKDGLFSNGNLNFGSQNM